MEIYRGISKYEQEWIQGNLVRVQNKHFPDCRINGTFVNSDDKRKISKSVIPESVGRFSGILDKYNRKIFQGDIISDGKFEYIVKYFEGNGFGKVRADGKSDIVTEIGIGRNFEIIGNVYQHPWIIARIKHLCPKCGKKLRMAELKPDIFIPSCENCDFVVPDEYEGTNDFSKAWVCFDEFAQKTNLYKKYIKNGELTDFEKRNPDIVICKRCQSWDKGCCVNSDSGFFKRVTSEDDYCSYGIKS